MIAPQNQVNQSNSDYIYDFDNGREAICKAVPIEKVARKYTDLGPFGSGGWFNGPCPRNHEDDSFYISPAGTWQCEECGHSGDVVDLAMLYGGYDSPSAAILGLATEHDVELPRERSGEALLRKLAAYVRRYVVLTDEQADLLALWVLHTHAFDAADTTPYLEIISAEKRSGKTRLLEVLDTIVARPWFTGRVTAAVLVRKIADEIATLLLDEADTAFKGDREYVEALRGILNSGFKRGGVASLCVGQGANLSYRDFPVFSPKAIAGIGKLPDTISDRCIRIELKRRARSEHVERFRLRKVRPEAEQLRRDAEMWAQAHIPVLTEMEPDLPEELDDRAQDIVEPLLAIASAVGGEWPERARGVVIALAGSTAREDSESLGVRLLRDTKSVFDKEDKDRLSTSTILEKLHGADEAPWGSLRGEALDARGLARLLKPYGIQPEQLRINEDKVRGYRRGAFKDAWERYLGDTPEEAVQAVHPADRVESDVPDKPRVPDSQSHPVHENPHRNGDVPEVPDAPPNLGGEERGSGVTAGKCKHDVLGGCWLCQREIERLTREGMAPHIARAEVLRVAPDLDEAFDEVPGIIWS
jgi:hypothetical protein